MQYAIWKYPVHWLAYGFGTMTDDVIAGIYTLIVLHIVRLLIARFVT
jgi:phosphatidylglycerophosphatase A